jgi:hypothetical protein
MAKLHCTHCGALSDGQSHPEPFDYSMGGPDVARMGRIRAWWTVRRYRRERGY